ncbi:MAG: hypothetical protein DMG88_20635 [Acidobacteria bacterium]|nr:MAG: hypothetical protein DMG88_20635 [Acidobacteriota bacterium]
MNDCFTQYYRCPEDCIRLALKGPLSEASGYFRFGPDTVCYGKCSGGSPSGSPEGILHDGLQGTSIDGDTLHLPFDLKQVVENLRYELYLGEHTSGSVLKALTKAYYLIRPLLPVGVRKHIQKWRLRGWDQLPFPHWPVDRTVDQIFEQVMLLSLRSQPVDRIPFIWFWPDGASSCAIMTHDVETAIGRDSCAQLMDMDDAFAIKAAFEIVPEQRYEVTPDYLECIRRRGFEIVVHDLNHDGRLFSKRDQFLERASSINGYKEQFGALGFRAAVLYRKQSWFNALNFDYDMSVPNVAHLDPQRGGCCTVMPYFVGKILELPVTTTQDYTLFHILNDYSIKLWKKQMDLIMEKHGLMSFIVHPDYIGGHREREVYEALLKHLAHLREERAVWITTPGEVNRWWRQRAEMKLVEDRHGWRIEGAGNERARIAYASENDGRIAYTVETPACVS